MQRSIKSFDPEQLRRLPDLPLRAAWLLDGLLAGLHRAHRFGTSLEFAQHRSYSPGDDTRAIDWRAYGRTDRLFIKQTHAETDATVHLLLDATPSLAFCGTRAPISKLEFAQLLALGLTHLILRQGDTLQLVTVELHRSRWLPTVSGELDWQRLIEELEPPPAELPQAMSPLPLASPHPFTDRLKSLLQALPGRRAGLVIIVSDFLDAPEQLIEPLASLRFAGYGCWLVQVTDPDESQLPDAGPCRLIDLEDGRQLELDPAAWQDAYAAQWQQHQDNLRQIASAQQTPLWSFSSDTSPIEALLQLIDAVDRGGQ